MSLTDRVIVIDNTIKKEKNIWCDLCNYVLVTYEDMESNKKNGCCEECWLRFGQARRTEWVDGWRPDKETLERYKLERSILNIKLKDIIGE